MQRLRGAVLNYALIHQAKFNITPSGDAYYVSEDEPRLFLIADGLGSGEKARDAAEIAISLARKVCLDRSADRRKILPGFFTLCHQKLKNSRGIALGCVLLDDENKEVLFCGVGNIRFVMAGGKIKSVPSQPGIVGSQLPRRISVKNISTEGYAAGFLFSDGISTRSVYRAASYPYRPPQVLADEIDKLNGCSDDKTLIVFPINY